MESVLPQYNFTTANDGSFTVFTYKKTPVSYKAALPLCFYTAIPAFLIACAIRPDSLMGGVMAWLFFMIGMGLAITAILNAMRKSGEFKINPQQVVVNEKSYAQDHVSAYFIKDPEGNTSDVTTVTVMHGNAFSMGSNIAKAQASIGQMGRESQRAIRKYIQDAGYKICIRYGSKDIAIAKGLGEREADVMLNKIKEVAQLNKIPTTL